MLPAVLPCPFCGSPAVLSSAPGVEEGSSLEISCTSCPARMEAAYLGMRQFDEAGVIAAWNRRVDEEQLRKRRIADLKRKFEAAYIGPGRSAPSTQHYVEYFDTTAGELRVCEKGSDPTAAEGRAWPGGIYDQEES